MRELRRFLYSAEGAAPGGEAAAGPGEIVVSEPVLSPEAGADASPSPAAEPSPTPTPTQTPAPATEPVVTLEPEEGTEQAVETALAEPGETPEAGTAVTIGSAWIVAAAALAAALIAAALYLALRRHRRKPAKAERVPGGITVGKVHAQGKRSSQQDCFAVSPGELAEEFGLLAVVADGMGGLADGDKVSQTAVNAMLDGFCNTKGEPQLVLLELLRKANLAVNRMLGPENLSKSGSTLAAALIKDGRFHWLTVGDSRICLLRDGVLYQLNREHVYKNELLLGAVNGSESFASALSNPRLAGLTSYLGMGRLKYVDMPAQPLELRRGDKYILMSDGVYNALRGEELVKALEGGAEEAARAVEKAIDAKNYKTQDNYTAVIIAVDMDERQEGR